MPLVRVSVPASLLADDKKSAMIANVPDALVEAEGVPGARPFTWELIDDVPDGEWGMAGRAVTLAKIQASLGKADGAV